MRLAAGALGLAAFGGLVVLAVAGVRGATAVLVTGGAVVAMIGLGNLVGGRHTADRAPYGAEPDIVEVPPPGVAEASGPRAVEGAGASAVEGAEGRGAAGAEARAADGAEARAADGAEARAADGAEAHGADDEQAARGRRGATER